MPPESLQLDGKDFFKERKHERSESLGSFSRWRDSSLHHGHQEFSRWGSAEFRRTPGYSKQGGWHLYPEETDQGYAPPRSTTSRGDGKYGRSSRKIRGSSQNDWTGHSSETCNGSPITPGRPADVKCDLRFVDETPINPSHPQSGLVNKCDGLPLINQDEKMGSTNGLGTGQRSGREKSLGSSDWKTVKWTRSGNLSSRGSSFSHSNSSKSMVGVDSNDVKAELLPKNETPIQSPSGEAATCLNSDVPSEDMISRKKARLGWGEGLAKYEKKKVEGPDETVNGTGVVCPTNSEPVHALVSTRADRSPTVMGFSDCASPATPSSVACSSSPGLEYKPYVKAASVENDSSNLCISLEPESQYHLEGFSFDLEKLDINSIPNLGSTLVEVLQSDDQSTVDSSYERSTAMIKLLVFKGDVLKAVEMTESEIDSLENELKLLRSESCRPCPATSSPLPSGGNVIPCQELGAPSEFTPRPTPLQIVSSEDGFVEEMPLCSGALNEVYTDAKFEDNDSPGTATSKFSESLSLLKEVAPSNIAKPSGCSLDLDMTQNPNMEVESSLSVSNRETICVSACCGDMSLQTDTEEILYRSILASNREFASGASEDLIKLLPKESHNVDISAVINVLHLQQNDSLVRETFVQNKLFLLQKEKVTAIKVKAMQHLWKEDLRLLSIRKQRAKSQKKVESNLQPSGGCKKHRSSIHSQFSSPGNLKLVPTTEMNTFLNQLLLNSEVKPHRSTLKMPEFNLNKSDVKSRMICSNGLVEDPYAVEKERSMINLWMYDEIENFKDKFATFGKDFRKIASFLTHKTTADCIEFYYKNHKSDRFEKTKKKLDVRKQVSTFMVTTSGKNWGRERNAVSLEVLGEVSVIASRARSSVGNQQIWGGTNSRTPRGDDILRRSGSSDISGNERETAAADVLAGMCNSLSSEAMDSCVTSSVDPGEGNRELNLQKVDTKIKRPLTPDVTQDVDDETCSDDSCEEMESGNWTDEEKSNFVKAVSLYGKDFAMISRCVKTKTRDQCRVFFSKTRKCLGLDLTHRGCADDESPVIDDANGDGSDAENACVVETESKLDKDSVPLVMDVKQEICKPAKIGNLQNDLNNLEETKPAEHLDHKDASPAETLVADACLTGVRPDQEIVPVKAAAEVSSEGFAKEVGRHQDFLPEILNNEQDEKCQSDTSKLNLGLRYLIQNFDTMINVSHLATSTSSCSGFSITPDSCHQDLKHLDSVQKPPIASLKKETSVATVNSVSQNLVPVKCEKKRCRESSTIEFQEGRDKQYRRTISGDDFQRKKSGNSLKHHESSQILKGHPLQMPTEKGMIGFISYGQLPKSEKKLTGQYLTEDCFLQKCNSLVAELPLLSQNTEQKSKCETEKPCGNGDVKLFGKILSPPLPQPKLNSNAQVYDEKVTHQPKNIKSFNPKINGQHNANVNSAHVKFDCNNFLGLENHPVRTYGFWDGNRIQTGFSSLPDSAVTLARYPATFRNYPMPASNMEPQLLHAGVRSGELNFNGAMVYPTREISGDSNGVVDCPVYRGWDITKVHPFTVDTEK